MNRIRTSIFIVALMLALVLSAFNVAPAFADEVTPPADETTTEEVVVSEEVVEETETTSTEEEAATPPADGETDSESSTESPSVAEVIESLPADTELIVVDENGEALPLASEEAAEIIAVADPQWCPVGVTPGAATCSGIKASFNGGDANNNLIQWLINNPPNTAGVIWIAHDYVGAVGLEGGAVVLDGDDYGNMANFALTINGGWSGTNGSKVINPNTPSTFEVPFIILNWTGAITINNIVVNGTNLNDANLGVQTAGNVTFNNVDVQNNTAGYGAFITNTGGTGTVTVNDSTFNNNTGSHSHGLEIYSNGTVTLKNVTANGNHLSGVYIDNSNATTPKAVTLNGTNHFSYNGEDGLEIYTKGVVTLNNITAMGNIEGYGAYLDNCEFNYGTGLCDLGVANGVTIKGTNNFSDNGYDGLRVWSGGAITVSNVTANGNGTSATRPAASGPFPDNFDSTGKGAFLFNYGSLTPKAITISGTNTFNDNASTGLHADSYGKVTVSNLTASFNGCDLIFEEDTSYCAGAYIYAEGGVTQTGYGRFESNAETGLLLYSFNKGAVLLNNLYADNSINGPGVVIIGAGTPPINVTLNGTNTFTDNLVGLVIDTDGIITVNNLTASGNLLEGAMLINATALTPKVVLIKGPAIFNDNGAFGLVVFSNGAVTTSGITAISNGGDGAIIDNCLYTLGTCAATTAQAVTLNGNNFFEGNNNLGSGESGLSIFSRGAITVNNLTSNYNWDDAVGAYLDNQFNNAVAGITLKGFVTTSFNDSNGLDILTNGAITIANITANGNGDGIDGYGVYLSNDTNPAKPMNVTITGTNQTSNNSDDGMEIYTYGTVLIYNLTANYNGNTAADDGLRIYNGGGTLARPVTLLGTNMFNGNLGYGLDIYSLGAITINNVMANYNGQSGAWLINSPEPLISQPVTIKGYGIFNNNGNASTHYGLLIESNGNVTLANITANDNGDYGTWIRAENNVKPTSFANVTITGVNTFNGNALGLWVETDGAITISNITANDNDDSGVELDNANLANGGLKNVTITGVNMFNGNEGNGLYISASGTVTLTRITANYNNDGIGNGSGLVVFTINGAINLTCGSMYNNADYGYDLNAGSGKPITIKGVFTFSNPLGNDSSLPTTITRTCPLP